LQISVVQRMKANHNMFEIASWNVGLLQISVVQRMKANHNIKGKRPVVVKLLQISVVQRMKANHNRDIYRTVRFHVVANISCSKNESKSQP
jgi:hypothetical protein